MEVIGPDERYEAHTKAALLTARKRGNFETLGRLMDTYFKASEEVDPETIIERQEEYQDYLQTQAWWGKRQKILARAKGRCERCHVANTGLEVHHMFYGKRGQEQEKDLVALCPTCHQEVHR